VFYGESVHTLDAKGRLFVPKRFQDELTRTPEGALLAYVTRGQDACLVLFSDTGFAQALAELQTRVFSGAELRAAQRVFFANTARIELDSSARLLIPEKLRAGASMGKEVVLIGVGDRAEIWPKETWQKYEAQHLDKIDHIDRVLAIEDPRKSP